MTIEELKCKISTWLNEPKWLNRLTLYLSLCAVIVGVLHIVFSYFGFFHTDVDSARYMLSALIQSEAAIVALVVTLSLVAVQLAAQSYSARVIEVFRGTPDLWILMGIYGGAMFYGLWVLKMIENPVVGRVSNLEGYVSFSYYLGVFAFVALVPYILNMFEMLKPSTVINMLAEAITKEKILDSIAEGQEKPTDKDPVQPIVDIVRGSLMKYDYETMRDGLSAISERTNRIFENEILTGDNEKKISEHIFNHITRVGLLAINKGDDFSTREVLLNLHSNGITAAKQELKEATWNAITSLHMIGTSAAENKLEVSTVKAAFFLGEIGKASIGKRLRILTKEAGWWEANILKEIGTIAVERKMEHAAGMVAVSLGVLGIEAAKNMLNNTTLNIVLSLEIIGIKAAEQKLEETKRDAAESLRWIINETVGIKALEDENEERKTSEVFKRIHEALCKLEQK